MNSARSRLLCHAFSVCMLAGLVVLSGCYYVRSDSGTGDGSEVLDDGSGQDAQDSGDDDGDSSNDDGSSGGNDDGSGGGSGSSDDGSGSDGSGSDGSGSDGTGSDGSDDDGHDSGSDSGDEGSGSDDGSGGDSSGNSGAGEPTDPVVEDVPPFVDDCGGQNDDVASLAGLVAVDYQTYSGVQLCAGEQDWYQINIPSGSWVSVELDIDGSGHNGTDMTDIDLVEADSSGDPIWWSASEQDYERLAWHNPGSSVESKTLFVYGYDGASSDYDIVIRVSEWDEGLDCDSFYPGTSPSSETGP